MPTSEHWDAIIDATSKSFDAKGEAVVPQLKRLLVLVWKLLPREERLEFLNRLSIDGKFTFEKREPLPGEVKGDLELTRCIHLWDRVLKLNLNDEERKFALSIQKSRKRRGWAPSDKQKPWIRALWDRVVDDGPEPEVVDHDDDEMREAG